MAGLGRQLGGPVGWVGWVGIDWTGRLGGQAMITWLPPFARLDLSPSSSLFHFPFCLWVLGGAARARCCTSGQIMSGTRLVPVRHMHAHTCMLTHACSHMRAVTPRWLALGSSSFPCRCVSAFRLCPTTFLPFFPPSRWRAASQACSAPTPSTASTSTGCPSPARTRRATGHTCRWGGVPPQVCYPWRWGRFRATHTPTPPHPHPHSGPLPVALVPLQAHHRPVGPGGPPPLESQGTARVPWPMGDPRV